MHFTTSVLLTLLSMPQLFRAKPLHQYNPRQVAYMPCPTGIYGIAQCCAVGILGLADLDCDSPPAAPRNATDFLTICAASGREAQCCAIPIAGQSLLCTDPPSARR
ncbi:hydrophobin [Roridomyces roridus]|uniref:Hydrophobin n=1 Tax=Roridomyces roridus TaxID=1738132 RepID=A0AAD7C9E1_9AGAR|nr:hydrophobin [Roridomyces roridus]